MGLRLLCRWRHVQSFLDIEQARFERSEATSYRRFVALDFCDALVVAFCVSVEGPEKRGLAVGDASTRSLYWWPISARSCSMSPFVARAFWSSKEGLLSDHTRCPVTSSAGQVAASYRYSVSIPISARRAARSDPVSRGVRTGPES
jgi:hypothetical protein